MKRTKEDKPNQRVILFFSPHRPAFGLHSGIGGLIWVNSPSLPDPAFQKKRIYFVLMSA
jgi:hypothetical protein